MARGTKLDLFIGASIEEDAWSEVTPAKKKSLSMAILPAKEHKLYFQRERRRGKIVTLVGPFSLSKEDQTKLLKKLKKQLGCGGSYKEGFMEFQGECKEKLLPLLQKESFGIKPNHL